MSNKMYSKIKQFSCGILISIFFLCISSILYAQNQLIMDDLTGVVGKDITFTISVKNIANAIESMGFEVDYDPSILEYKNNEKGDLTQNDLLMVNLLQDGKLRVGHAVINIGGSAINPIPVNSTGIIVKLIFNVKKSQYSELALVNFNDDIVGWSARNGHLLKDVQGPSSDEVEMTLWYDWDGDENFGITPIYINTKALTFRTGDGGSGKFKMVVDCMSFIFNTGCCPLYSGPYYGYMDCRYDSCENEPGLWVLIEESTQSERKLDAGRKADGATP